MDLSGKRIKNRIIWIKKVKILSKIVIHVIVKNNN